MSLERGGRRNLGRTIPSRLGLALTLVLAAGLVGVVVSVKSSHAKVAAQRPHAQTCIRHTYPSQGRKHLATTSAHVAYNSFPPTSGPHYFMPIPWGSYTTSLSLVQEVHNLEHGGIIIQWGTNVSASDISHIKRFYSEDTTAMLIAPLPALGSAIALTAWRHLETCNHFDSQQFVDFRRRYRYLGPEKYPKYFLVPGHLQPSG